MPSRRLRLPTIALVGRANVGKSTLFNRLLEEERAIVSKTPGTTRDRNYGIASWRGVKWQFVDTGGLDVSRADELEKNVIHQAELAIKEADLILFCVDLETGALPQDHLLSAELRKSKKPVLLVGNKADNPRIRANAFDPAWPKMRLGEVFPVSAKNGAGVGDLLDAIYAVKGLALEKTIEPETIIAIIGKPNVGKSSLVNSLCREERVIVSAIPGTTREPEDTLIMFSDAPYLLIDTVGLRREQSHAGPLESEGMDRTRRSIERAEVIFLVLDLSEKLSAQDRVLAGEVEKSGKAVILVANKWDLVPGKTAKKMEEVRRELSLSLPFFRFAPINFVSAKTGFRVDDLLLTAGQVKSEWQKMIPDRALDAFFRRTVKKGKGPNRPYIYKMLETGTEPPTFALTIRGKEPVPEAFLRWLENRLREKFGFIGTPIRLRGRNIQIKPL
jgi:GTP-binding protein